MSNRSSHRVKSYPPIISTNLPGHSKTFSLRPRSPTSLLLLGKRYLEDLEEEGGTFPKEFLDALLDDVGRVSKRRAMVWTMSSSSSTSRLECRSPWISSFSKQTWAKIWHYMTLNDNDELRPTHWSMSALRRWTCKTMIYLSMRTCSLGVSALRERSGFCNRENLDLGLNPSQ